MTSSFLAGAQAAEAKFRSLDGTSLTATVVMPDSLPPKGTVVALHGCGGLFAASDGAGSRSLNARHQALADLLQDNGYAVVFPDSFAARNEVEQCSDKTGAGGTSLAERRADAWATMAWVAAQPWARADRIALLGWSDGGDAVLWATDASQAAVKARPVQPKVAIAFYADCSAALKAGYKPAAPLALMLGGEDLLPCLELAKEISVELFAYPDIHAEVDQPGAARAAPSAGRGRAGRSSRQDSSHHLLTLLERAFHVRRARVRHDIVY